MTESDLVDEIDVRLRDRAVDAFGNVPRLRSFPGVILTGGRIHEGRRPAVKWAPKAKRNTRSDIVVAYNLYRF